jgi:hypothetical protein
LNGFADRISVEYGCLKGQEVSWCQCKASFNPFKAEMYSVFIPYREYSVPPLEMPIIERCAGKQLLFIVRTIQTNKLCKKCRIFIV